jgi:hypothetical protein
VRAANKTIAIPNGNGTIRLRYKVTNGSQRARLFAAGSYAYYQTDDVESIANNSTAATNDLVIATSAGAGSNLVIIPIATRLLYISGKVNVNGTVVDIPLTSVPPPAVAGLYYMGISSAVAVSKYTNHYPYMERR